MFLFFAETFLRGSCLGRKLPCAEAALRGLAQPCVEVDLRGSCLARPCSALCGSCLARTCNLSKYIKTHKIKNSLLKVNRDFLEIYIFVQNDISMELAWTEKHCVSKNDGLS